MTLKLIIILLLPLMRTAIQALRNKDENSTGFDDAAADQLETAANGLERYAVSLQVKV